MSAKTEENSITEVGSNQQHIEFKYNSCDLVVNDSRKESPKEINSKKREQRTKSIMESMTWLGRKRMKGANLVLRNRSLYP